MARTDPGRMPNTLMFYHDPVESEVEDYHRVTEFLEQAVPARLGQPPLIPAGRDGPPSLFRLIPGVNGLVTPIFASDQSLDLIKSPMEILGPADYPTAVLRRLLMKQS